MSNEDKSRKTEEATPHKLQKARERGEIPKSQEIVSALGLIVSTIALLAAAGFMGAQVLTLFDAVARAEPPDAAGAFAALARAVIYASAPVVIVALLAGIVANVIQFGVIVAPEQIKLDFKRIDPIKGFGRIFSSKKLLEILKAAVKIVALGAAAAWITGDHLSDFALIKTCGIDCGIGVVGVIIGKLMLTLLPLLIILSALDYKLQRTHFLKEQRMTKDELKRERKDTLGSPEMRGERRRLQQETALTPGLEGRVKETTVIASDGRHVVGLLFDEERAPVPIVHLRERGAGARIALRHAVAHDKTVLEEPETARLYNNATLDEAVSKNVFDIVAPLIVAARQQAASDESEDAEQEYE